MTFIGDLFGTYKRVRRLFHDPAKLGAHAIVLDGESVLLVRLTYYSGWFLPGGGVERNESFEDAAKREILEECGIETVATSLLGLYLNRNDGTYGHVAVYIMHAQENSKLKIDRLEITEARFFPIAKLPYELWGGHRRRIEEFRGLRKIESTW